MVTTVPVAAPGSLRRLSLKPALAGGGQCKWPGVGAARARPGLPVRGPRVTVT